MVVAKQFPPSTSSQSRPSAPQSASLAWAAMIGLAFFTIALALLGAGAILRPLFPLCAFAVGLLLYIRYPIHYIGFTWWLWFLTPFLRRIIDFNSGWDQSGLILVTPFLVTVITLESFIRTFPNASREGTLPFVIVLLALGYGFSVGLLFNPVVTVVRTMLDWFPPVIFGFYLASSWRRYPALRQVTQQTFLWSTLITGGYGVFQYIVAPEWDRFWLIQTQLTSMGTPEPLGLRVWSTMNSPAPFASVMLAGLLLVLTRDDLLQIPASIVGYLSFLMTLVRSAWGGWAVGMLTLLVSLKAKFQMRLIMVILVMVACIAPLTMMSQFSSSLTDRFETFTNIQNDTSFKARRDIYNQNLEIALSSALGQGIGGTWFINEKGELEEVVLDSGILDIFFALGWFGGVPYLGGMLLLLYTLFRNKAGRSDPFSSAIRAISFCIVSQLIFSSLMLELSGLILWSFLGLGIAEAKYYLVEKTVNTHHKMIRSAPDSYLKKGINKAGNFGGGRIQKSGVRMHYF